jgi:uncharacterized membrane protein
MGLFTVLAAIVILYLLAIILNKSSEQKRLLESLYDKIKNLSGEVSLLSQELKKKEPVIAVQPIFKQPPLKDIITEQPPVIKKETIPVVPKPVNRLLKEPAVTKKEIPEVKKEDTYKEPAMPVAQPKASNENKDLEKYIGENLISKIGIAILILGISFFIKYAIDKDWINETGRVIIGFFCGTVLLGVAHRFRNMYRSFSSVLVGGGLTVFYFSTAFAFHQYHLIGQTAAFIVMVAITGFAVFLSVFYYRLELAILAVIGGFITPFLASAGNDNYIALFIYLCILNTGIIALSWYKRWSAINSIALFFTTIIFGGWLFQKTNGAGYLFPYKDALLFATIFYLLFMAMHLVNNVRLKRKFAAFDFIMVLGTNALYYLAGLVILTYISKGEGLFTFLTGLFNLLLYAIFYRQKTVDRVFVSLLLALSLTFISLAVPVQFNGNITVLFWAAESVILLWLFRRTGTALLFYGSLATAALSVAGLLLNWTTVYFMGTGLIPVILNKGFITGLFAGISLAVYYHLLRREQKPALPALFSLAVLKNPVCVALISILFLTGLLEIYYQFTSRVPHLPVHFLYMALYTFSAAVLIQFVFHKSVHYPVLKLSLTLLCMGIYLTSITSSAQLAMNIGGTARSVWFLPHWAAAILLLWMLYSAFRFFFSKQNEKWESYKDSLGWLMSACILVVLSAELYQFNIWANLHDDWPWWRNLYYKAGLSILWGMFSFILIWVGMKHNHKVLRIISLGLFTITVVKLFIYDIRNIPPGGKIAAFILLGVLLLVVSFMYQRLKKIIIDNNAE